MRQQQAPMAPNSSNMASQFSDFGDPPLALSDSEDELTRKSDIPPSFVNNRTVNQQVNQQERFKSMASSYAYSPQAVTNQRTPSYSNGSYNYNQTSSNGSTPQKRAADDSSSAYSNFSRPQKQARTLPPLPRFSGKPKALQPARVMTISDIEDFDLRRRVEQINRIVSTYPIQDVLNALHRHRLNVDDALNYIMEQQTTTKKTVDLTGDDDLDAEGETDSDLEIVSVQAVPTANRNNQAHAKGISAYSRLAPKLVASSQELGDQQISPPRKKPLSRLHRGIRPDTTSRSPSISSSITSRPISNPPTLVQRKRPVVTIDSDEDEDGDATVIEKAPELKPAQTVDLKVFEFFKSCTEKDLIAIIDCKSEDAEFLLSNRPFKSMAQLRKVAREAAPGKRRGGIQRPLGERLVDLVISVEQSFEAVDRIVELCDHYSRDVQREMQAIGVDMSKAAKDDGLNILSFEDVDSRKIDSGTGTPNTGTRITQPSNMSQDRTLKDYQVVGLNWLNIMFNLGKQWERKAGCILADEMGLGKTYQVIAFISHLVNSGSKGKHLIVVPTSTLENWLREFQQFSPDIHVEPYYGKQAIRIEQQGQIEEAGEDVQVIITTYPMAASEKDNYWLRKTFRFETCIFDEGHMLKNAKSKRYQALRSIRSDFRLFLTGTPLQNNLQELVSVLAFLMPTLFDDAEDDLELIFNCKAKTADTEHAALLASQRTNRAKSMLKPFILRRTKDQVLKDLPPKTNRLILCDMPPHQKEVYDYFTEVHEKALEERKNGRKPDKDETKFPHLTDRQLSAIHPLLRRWYFGNDFLEDTMLPKLPRKGRPWGGKSNETILNDLTWLSDWEVHAICEKHNIKGKFKDSEWMDSGKVQKLVELLKEYKAQGSRTLIFSQFTKVLDILHRVLETEQITNVRLDGGTATEERQPLIDMFNNDPSIQAFMITTRSGGAGINLASADRVIIFDPSFNPQDDLQAANRAHRIGQTKPVEVVTLVTKGTIEEQIYKLGLSKLALDQRVAGAEDEGDAEKASTRLATANMKLLEEMLLKGQATPLVESDAEDKKEVKDKKERSAKDKEKKSAKDDTIVNTKESGTVHGEGEKKEAAETKMRKSRRKSPVKEAVDVETNTRRSPRKSPIKDVKDEFKDAMKGKGIAFAKD